MDIIRNNITEGAKARNLFDEMGEFLTKDKEVGHLKRYTAQITTDAINQVSAQQHQFIAEGLGMESFTYLGTIVDKSRPFCRSLVKKKYVHKSEFGKVANGNFIPKPKSLAGQVPGTNASNLFVFRGGYNCGHQFMAVETDKVPKEIREAIA